MVQEYTEWEINRMKQRYYEINNSISKYTNQININNEEITKISKRINELVVIKRKLKQSNDKFEGYINIKRRKFEMLKNNYYNTKFAKSCSEEMLGFIKGRETSKARQNIENAIYEVQNKSNRLEYELEELKRNNNILRNRITDLEYEKRSILQKGVI